MARPARAQYVCQSCGAVSPRWVGKCAGCGEWNTLVEEANVGQPGPGAGGAGRASKGRIVALQSLAEAPPERFERMATGLAELDRVSRGRATLAAAMMTAAALVLFLPWRATDKYYQFRGMRADIRQLAATHGFDGDLVLVRGPREPDYMSAAVYNPLDLLGRETIYAWDRSAEVRKKTLEVYADRRVWVVDGPTITGAGYRLVQGPLPAAAVLAAGGPR